MSQSNLSHKKPQTVTERIAMGIWGYITFASASSVLVQAGENSLLFLGL